MTRETGPQQPWGNKLARASQRLSGRPIGHDLAQQAQALVDRLEHRERERARRLRGRAAAPVSGAPQTLKHFAPDTQRCAQPPHARARTQADSMQPSALSASPCARRMVPL